MKPFVTTMAIITMHTLKFWFILIYIIYIQQFSFQNIINRIFFFTLYQTLFVSSFIPCRFYPLFYWQFFKLFLILFVIYFYSKYYMLLYSTLSIFQSMWKNTDLVNIIFKREGKIPYCKLKNIEQGMTIWDLRRW